MRYVLFPFETNKLMANEVVGDKMSQYMEESEWIMLKRWIALLLLSVFILLGTFHRVFALMAFGIMALLIFLGEEEFGWMILFFSIQLANIFKLSPNSTSLFTFLVLIFVIRLFLKKQKVSGLLVFLGLYMLIIPSLSFNMHNFNVLRWIKLISNIMLMIYFFDDMDEKRDVTNFFLSFIVGNIVSSFFRYLDSDFFRISSYTEMVGVGGNGLNESYYELGRFSGLYNDPNYYSVNIIISLCLVVILFHKEKIKIPFFVLVNSFLIFFVISTYSKSAILMLFLPVVMFLYSNKKTGKVCLQLFVIIALFVIILYVLRNGSEGVLGVVLDRFRTAGRDVNKLTTGRFDLWIRYLDFLRKNFMIFLFGQGIGASFLNGKVPHNTYIDLLYYLGLVGTILILSVFKQISELNLYKIKRNIMNYSIMICILIMYFFLSELFYIDAPFHLCIALIVLNLDMNNERLIV